MVKPFGWMAPSAWHHAKVRFLSRSKQSLLWGLALFAVGLAIFVYLSVFDAPYAGASGAGLAGLGAGLAVLGAMILMALGLLLAVVAMIIAWVIKRRQRQDKI